MKFVASNSVIQGEEIIALLKKEELWIVISKYDNTEENQFDESDFEFVDEEYLINRVPGLEGNLEQPDETIISINPLTGEINFNKKHFHFGIPTHSARATRQANTEYSYLRWLKFNKKKYFKLFYWVVGLSALGVILGWFFYLLIPIPIILRYLIDSKVRDMYHSGALLPGIVIDETKSRIAVLTDLSLGGGNYPIIKIENVVLPISHRKEMQKLAIAGGYNKTEDYNHWNFFEPFVLICGMKYPNRHKEKIDEVPAMEWDKLLSEIKKLDQEIEPGYYPIDLEESDWKNVDIASIEWVHT